MTDKLQALIDELPIILITSHLSPDPDAVCSSLLLFTTLKLNYPTKKIRLVLEDKPNVELDFLSGYDEIQFMSLRDVAEELNSTLIIMTDANKISRCSRSQTNIKVVKLAAIDHHEQEDADKLEVFINNASPAATQDVYELIEQAGWRWPEGYAETALLGILSDTFRFRYDNPRHKDTFRIVSQLIDAGASIEKLESKLNRYNKKQLEVLGHLSTNSIATDQGFSYSWVYDDFTNKWLTDGNSSADLKTGCEIFVNQFVRNIENNLWGFIVYPDLAAGDHRYAVSFRSTSNSRNVAEIASKMGGGGHIPAAGAKFEADNMLVAINMVLKAIENSS